MKITFESYNIIKSNKMQRKSIWNARKNEINENYADNKHENTIIHNTMYEYRKSCANSLDSKCKWKNI